MHCAALHCAALRCAALRCAALRCVALRCVALLSDFQSLFIHVSHVERAASAQINNWDSLFIVPVKSLDTLSHSVVQIVSLFMVG